jgi:hypothetical protein
MIEMAMDVRAVGYPPNQSSVHVLLGMRRIGDADRSRTPSRQEHNARGDISEANLNCFTIIPYSRS